MAYSCLDEWYSIPTSSALHRFSILATQTLHLAAFSPALPCIGHAWTALGIGHFALKRDSLNSYAPSSPKATLEITSRRAVLTLVACSLLRLCTLLHLRVPAGVVHF